jgi:hypothetical protein
MTQIIRITPEETLDIIDSDGDRLDTSHLLN